MQNAARVVCALCAQILFIICIILCFLLVVIPIIHRLNLTMKRNRSMLLLFPEELIHNVPEIRGTMLDYVKTITS